MNSTKVVELFGGGWLQLGERLPQARVIVARHRVPEPGTLVTVGKLIDEWVYELFITPLGADGFLVEDVLDLYHGRGAFEAILADEDVEGDPDRWCSYTECGQELWQIAWQWVWNLRLSLGQMMQGTELRDTRWAPPKESPSFLERKPIILGPMRWVDVAGRALRRTWTAHWRSQYVEVLPLAEMSKDVSPPPRPPRAVRSHHRWSWLDRLAQNAWWGPPHLRITVAGVPDFLAVSKR